MTPTLTLNPLDLPPTSREKLHHLTSIIHLLHHRNKNQHRRSIWWRTFSLFRRELTALTTAISQHHTQPTTNLGRTQKKSRDVALRATTEKRMVFWRDVMVPRWQFGFGQVVADGRFAVLGVVLMAMLGEVCGVVGIVGEYEELGEREVEKVLEKFAGEEWGLERGGFRGREVEGKGEDRGEVVRREVHDDELGGREVGEKTPPGATKRKEKPAVKSTALSKVEELDDSETSTTKTPMILPTPFKRPREKSAEGSEPTVKKSKKKKRKKGDAIDDLFDF